MTGLTGPTGTVGTVTTVAKEGEVAFKALGVPATVTATCGANELPMSGGYTVSVTGVTPVHSLRTATGWEVQFENESNAEVGSAK